MRKLLNMIFVMVSRLPPDSLLYSECVVKKSVEITTFEDSVKFWFVRTGDEDLKIKFDQGAGMTFTMQYGNLTQHEWLQAELMLRLVPKLYIQGMIQQHTGRLGLIRTRKTFIIEGVDILLQCPQGWPNRELSSLGSDVRISTSGEEESVVLTPTVETKVSFSVSKNKRILCWNTSSGVEVVGGEESDCGDMRSNSAVTLKFLFEDKNVVILNADGRQLDFFTFQGVRDLRFLSEGLKGPVYIAQCIGNCLTATATNNDEVPTNNTTVTSAIFTKKTASDGPADLTPWYDYSWLISVSIFFIVLTAFDALIIAFVCSIFKKL